MARGRPTNYRVEYCKSMLDYFTVKATEEEETSEETVNIEDGKFGQKKKLSKKTSKRKVGSGLPTLEGWCCTLPITMRRMYDWIAKHEDFKETYMLCKQIQKNMLVQNTLLGRYQPGFAMFLAKNITDLKDDPKEEAEEVELIV